MYPIIRCVTDSNLIAGCTTVHSFFSDTFVSNYHLVNQCFLGDMHKRPTPYSLGQIVIYLHMHTPCSAVFLPSGAGGTEDGMKYNVLAPSFPSPPSFPQAPILPPISPKLKQHQVSTTHMYVRVYPSLVVRIIRNIVRNIQ